MFEQLRSREAATISTVIALGIGVTACGSQEPTEQPDSTSGLKINVQLEYCEGQDLIIGHAAKDSSSIRIERRPNDPRCADGTLSPGHTEQRTPDK